MRTSPARGGAFFFVLGFLLFSLVAGPHPVHRLLLPGAGEALHPHGSGASFLAGPIYVRYAATDAARFVALCFHAC